MNEAGPHIEDTSSNLRRWTSEEQNRLNRQRETNEVQSNSIFNAIYETVIAAFLIILLVMSRGARCGKGVKEIIIISFAIRIGFLAPLNFILHYLVKHRKMNPSVVGMINSIIGLPFVGWYIFITVHFFKSAKHCTHESSALYWGFMILLVESFFYYIKLIVVLIIVVAVVTYCGIHHSLSKRKKKRVKLKQILLGIGNLKMKRDYYEPDDVCSICCEQFSADQNIIRLPCNNKHYFHDNCIGEWINNNPSCPLCKFKITEEVFQKFVEKPEGRDSSLPVRFEAQNNS
ncbi:unnamed protein product [Moneuplotes crassus]|uniref:RING-type domain-containing protein n=1 Tax=Euplotes crassus TaxID=5936 RepID=A0AAD1XEV9_EUPCR|nr:unnamed protein product [Moneuplotes crassus]